MVAEELEEEDRVKKERSPSFPFISLPRAIDRAQSFAANHRKAAARVSTVAQTWGYRPKSSGLQQTIAALKAFGLLEDVGGGEERKVQLTELAWRILNDARAGARETAIREAALKPRLIQDYIAVWLPERPSDAHCISELHLDRNFTPEAAKTFLRVFDETVSFAGLRNDEASAATEKAIPEQREDEIPRQRESAAVGSFAVRPHHHLNNQATFPLPEGIAALELPPKLSRASFEDVKAWIEVVMRRVERTLKEEEPSS